ncbi:MAG TPA: hypothetical protein VGN76_16455, partial [Gemmatimonadales bacterium]|nr:hypothetical protein [Gemmatimonadales bacterium]
MRLIHAGPPSLVRIALAAGAVSGAYAYQQTESSSQFASAGIVALKSSSITRSGGHEPTLVRRTFADTSHDGDIVVLTWLGIDSTRVILPAPPPPPPPAPQPPPRGHGIPFGPFHLPIDSLCSEVLGYTGTTLVGKASRLARDLDKVRDCKGRVVLQLARKKMLDNGEQLSVQASREELESWRDAADIRSYLRDTTIFAIYVGDDIKSKEWGVADSALRLARFDSIAGVVKSFWGDSATTILRAPPTSMTGHVWRWVDAAWAQYDGPYRDGPPEKYRDTEVGSAKAQKLGLILWFNALDGGCGPVSKGSCLPKVPGTPIYGTYSDTTVRRYQVSAAEAGYYGAMFLAEPYNCAAIQWQWSPVWNGSGRSPEQVA